MAECVLGVFAAKVERFTPWLLTTCVFAFIKGSNYNLIFCHYIFIAKVCMTFYLSICIVYHLHIFNVSSTIVLTQKMGLLRKVKWISQEAKGIAIWVIQAFCLAHLIYIRFCYLWRLFTKFLFKICLRYLIWIKLLIVNAWVLCAELHLGVLRYLKCFL